MAKSKKITINIDGEDVMYTNISKYKDGYNSARIVVKKGDKEYMTVSYEWEGNHIPDFVMSLMGFMQANNVETSGIWPEKEEVYIEYSDRENKEEK